MNLQESKQMARLDDVRHQRPHLFANQIGNVLKQDPLTQSQAKQAWCLQPAGPSINSLNIQLIIVQFLNM